MSLWRIREYVRPYYRSLALTVVAAHGLAVSAEIAIPLLTKSVIDSAIHRASRDAAGRAGRGRGGLRRASSRS